MGEKRVKWYDRQRVDLADMNAEQGYTQTRIGNIFARALGDGVISGLQVSDDSEIANQATQNANYDTLLDTLNNQVIQIFNATADNIQHVIVRGRNVGAAGNVTASIVSLSTPSDSTSALSTVVGQVTVASGSFAGAYGEVTFDFSAVAAVADAGSLTVGSYYALTIERDNIVGSIDISYSTANPYSAGFVKEYDSTTYTNRLTWDLYFKIYTDAVQVSTGYAYKQGNPIEMTSAKRKLNLADTSGATNYIYIKYKETETDAELHPRTGVSTYSRVEDDYEFTVKTSATADDDEEVIGSTAHSGVFPLTIVDRRINIPARNTLWDAYTNKNVRLIGETVVAGLSVKDCIYYNTTNTQWEKANFTNLPQGILTASGEVTIMGNKTGLTGLTTGWYYMDGSGDLTTTKTIVRMGYARSTTDLLVDIDIANENIILSEETIIAGLSIKDCIYYNTINSQWEKASFTNMPQGILTNTSEVTLFGRKVGLTGLTAGWYYMDNSGDLTTIPTHIKIGYARSTTDMLVDIDIQRSESDIIIDNQADFEYYFGTGADLATGATGTTSAGWTLVDSGGNETVTIPNDINIYLKSNPTDGTTSHFKYDATNFPYEAYTLKTMVTMQTGLTIHGDGIDQSIVILNDDDTGFQTTSLVGATNNITSWATSIFTMDTIALADVFKIGMTVHNSLDNAFYTVTAHTVGTKLITVDRTITGVSANASLFACQDSIELKDFTIDGRGGIDNLGGSRSGRCFDIQYCVYSTFKEKVINVAIIDTAIAQTNSGVVYFGNLSSGFLTIKNIYHCGATINSDLNDVVYGGAVGNIKESEISNIYYCKVDGKIDYAAGGAIDSCISCNIHDIFGCYVRSSRAVVGVESFGGGISNCTYCKIIKVENCWAEITTAVTSGTTGGGACFQCDNSEISLIKSCYVVGGSSTSALGGACYVCDNCSIDNIHNCYATNGDNDAEGGACISCNSCSFTGAFTGNTSDVANNTLDNCTTSAWSIVHDGTAAQATGTANIN